MKFVKEPYFLNTIGTKGIVLDPQYPKSPVLGFVSNPDMRRFWVIPDEARRIPHFAELILNLLDPWKSIFVWKPLGSWSEEIKGERLNDDIQALIYKGIGIKENSSDILVFDHKELQMLVALMFNQLVFGWHVGDDLYLIPDNGQYIIKTDHHDVVHVEFHDYESLSLFVKAMSDEGFQLPDKLPDPTFKKPDWMK